MALQFQRNAKVYVELLSGSPSTSVFQIPVLAGFSFSQSMNASEVTVSEAGIASRRARLMFNDSLAPVEWSCSTYIRPISTTAPDAIVAPEMPLWAMLMGANAYAPATRQFFSTIAQGSSATGNSPSPFGSPSPTSAAPTAFQAVNSGSSVATANTFDFSASNTSYFGAGANIWFAFVDGGGSNVEYFKLTDAVVNSVTIDFDIEGIATAQWSGFATKLESTTGAPNWTTSGSPTSVVQTTGVVETTNFIRNRLSLVTLQRTSGTDDYSLILTGGSFTVENNISYLIPEQLGIVNKPIGNITGTRSISGSLTCYYDDTETASSELFIDQLADTNTVRNVFDMSVLIGGTTGPRIELDLPTAHLEIPTIGVDDLLTLEVNFHGQVANGNVDNTNEATIIYKA